MSHGELRELLAGAVGGLHTMQDEHFGISIVEYMAAGRRAPAAWLAASIGACFRRLCCKRGACHASPIFTDPRQLNQQDAVHPASNVTLRDTPVGLARVVRSDVTSGLGYAWRRRRAHRPRLGRPEGRHCC